MTARELKSEKIKKQRADTYRLVVNFYTQMLRCDSMNAYAANGLAITIAENGHIEQAKDIFNQVREANVANPNGWVNLAHAYVELIGDCDDTNWLFCLARAQYILTKSEKEHEAMYESLKNTERALHLNPSDKTILYNLALVQQSYAQQIADLSLEQRDSISMHCAIRHLECGQRTFRAMVHVDEHTLYDKKIVKQRERYGETLHTQLERKLTEQIRFEEEKRQKFEFAKKKREEEAAAEKEKCRLEQTEKEKMKEARRRWMRKVREDNRMRASRQVDKGDMDEEKKAKRRNRKRKERGIEEEEEKIEKKNVR